MKDKANIHISGPGVAEVKTKDILKSEGAKRQFEAMRRLKRKQVGIFKRDK